MTQSALESLNRTALVRFAASFVGEDVAEDIVQDVYVKLLQPHAPFRDGAALQTWAMAIVKNTAIDYLRGPADPYQLQTDNDTNAPSQLLSLEQTRAMSVQPIADELIDLRRAIDRLPAPLRDAMRASLDYPDRASAAASLGLTLDGYRSRLKKGKQQLARALKGDQ